MQRKGPASVKKIDSERQSGKAGAGIAETVRITDASPVTIGPGVAAIANELQVGRLVDRTFVGATLNITGGSLAMGGDQFTLWGGGNGVFVNQNHDVEYDYL